jgi:hypothetical protein
MNNTKSGSLEEIKEILICPILSNEWILENIFKIDE